MKRSLSDAGTSSKAGESSSVSGAVDASAFDTHLASCIKLTSASHYKPTWELVKGGPPLLHEYSIADRMGPLPMLPEVCAMEAFPHAVVDTQVFKMRRSVDSRSWENKLNSHLVAAIRKWAGIILIFRWLLTLGVTSLLTVVQWQLVFMRLFMTCLLGKVQGLCITGQIL